MNLRCMMSSITLLLLQLLLVINISATERTANILTVLPVSSKSHQYMFQAIVKELVNRGHNVTLISPYKINLDSKNLNQIVLHTSLEKEIDSMDYVRILAVANPPIFSPEFSFWKYGLRFCEEYLKSSELQKLIHSKDQMYDVIMLETSFGQESFMGFSHKFNAPVISLNSVVNFLFLDEFIGNPLSLSTVPISESRCKFPMTFYQRTFNVFRSFLILTYGYYFYLPKQEILMKTYFNHTSPENLPSLTDMLKNNISLAISNSHISIENSRPLVPNSISAAGVHINKKPSPLPKDIQEYMDYAKNGVIYFSFGTIFPVHHIPTEIKTNFLNAFSKLEQNILWKANMDSMENLPKNVKVAKWLPQQSILAHPNCVAFITHGGLLSMQESIYFGIPLIAIPMFSDQHMNAERAKNAGSAFILGNNNLTEESIYYAINEVVTNKRYKQSAVKNSRIFRDNPVDPLDNAIFWIEYVIRYKGAHHLRTSKLDLNFFQRHLLDVILFVVFVISTLIAVLYVILRYFLKIFRHKMYKHICDKKNK